MEGEVLTMGPLTIRILEDGRNTDNRIGTMILRIKGGSRGPPIHVCFSFFCLVLILVRLVREEGWWWFDEGERMGRGEGGRERGLMRNE